MSVSNYRNLTANSIDGVFNVRNYIQNAFSRTDVNGWNAYADAAGSSPVDGTGGSPNFAVAHNTSSPLRFNADFLLTKGASNLQGQGVSYDFTIDSVDAGKLLSISFDYSASANFVTGTASDLQVFVYDVSAAALIPVTRQSILTAKGFYTSSFQSSSNTSYRLIFHIATTNALAWTVQYTNVQVNATQSAASGPIISDWINAGPTIVTSTGTAPVKGTIVTDEMWYRRVGSNMELRMAYRQSAAGTTGSGGDYLFQIPTGYLIDTTKVTASTRVANISVDNSVGSFMQGDHTNAQPASGAVVVYDSTNVRFAGLIGLAAAYEYVTGRHPISGDQGFGHAADWSLNAIMSIPISGWSSNTAVANSGIIRISDVLANGTRVTTTPAALGQYRTRTRTINSATSYNDNAPGTGPSSSDGMKIFNRTYNSSEVANNTEMWDIFVGKNKSLKYQYYSTTGRTGLISTDVQVYGGSNDTATGIATEYDPTTGVVSVFAPTQSTATGAGFVGQTSPGTYAGNCYFDIFVADNDFQIQLQSTLNQPVYLKSVRATNTDDGTFTSGAYRTRTLNTIENSQPWISLSSNQFTLDSGTYEIEAVTPAFAVDQYKSKLANITDSTDTIIGSTGLSAAGNTVQTNTFVIGTFTISKSTTFEIQSRCTTTKTTNGFGAATNYGDSEVYTQVKLKKLV